MQRLLSKQTREEKILLSLKKLGYLSRSQLQRLHNLGTARNASRVMQQMSEYVTSFRDTENVYYLSKGGRDRVDSQIVRKKTVQARHYLMRNDVYIAEGLPRGWKNEIKLEVKGKVKVIADAVFERSGQLHIVEVDHTQLMSQNRSKVEKYKKLLSLNVFKTPPVFIWITTTEYRRKQIKKLLQGTQHKIYTVEDLR